MGICPTPCWRAIGDQPSGRNGGISFGGCVEGAVVLEAIEALEKGTHMLLEYGVSDGDAFAVGLPVEGTFAFWWNPLAM